ncbi:hypothetical protein ALQ97_101054 [Pseudomonas savastanoi pv. glycinea]|nr:hypothetical protein ALQ97_101054 [Pseudomonas savastanoi pv. glycinea]
MNDLHKTMQCLCQLAFTCVKGISVDASGYFCTALRRAAQKQGGLVQ